MKKKFFIVAFILISNIVFSQKIDNEIILKVQNEFSAEKNMALINAISRNSYKSLVVSNSNIAKEDHFFTYEVKSGSVTNQNNSGRCWMFTSLNTFRPGIIKKLNLSDFQFSHSYLFFWDIFEKSNMFLERIIATASLDIYSREVTALLSSPVSDGGAWSSFVNLVDKYGVVPQNVMPETHHSNNTSELSSILDQLLRKYALELREMVINKKTSKDIQNRKIQMLSDVYKILVYSLGEPPKSFQWRYKDKNGKISDYQTYTPVSFWKSLFNVNLNDFVMFMDDPTRPYYQLYSKQFDKNTYEGNDWTFINLPATEIKKYIILSLKDTQMLYFSCDVGKMLSKENGSLDINNYNYSSLFGIDFSMDRKQQILTQQSGSTHGMALCGVELDKNEKPIKWKLENSWGADYGNRGYLTMTDQWFDLYFYRVVINKKYIDSKTLEILKQKPIEVPFYNNAFSNDN